MARTDDTSVSVESLAARLRLSWFHIARVVLWPDLAFCLDAAGISPESACVFTYLPRLRICTLYSRQCLPCSDTCFMDIEVWSVTPHSLCQYDGRIDYKDDCWCTDLCSQSHFLG